MKRALTLAAVAALAATPLAAIRRQTHTHTTTTSPESR